VRVECVRKGCVAENNVFKTLGLQSSACSVDEVAWPGPHKGRSALAFDDSTTYD
jgi:hypothetical protein